MLSTFIKEKNLSKEDNAVTIIDKNSEALKKV
jgi:Trk K+ transport system NAD-binding subunit